jgi:hypothetical protein
MFNSPGETEVTLIGDQPDRREFMADKIQGIVGRAIIDQDNFELQALNTLVQRGQTVRKV